jgi:hypothetical protein
MTMTLEQTAAEIITTLKKLGQAKADPFEMAMVERLVRRGIDEESARNAARECSNRIWRNGMLSGAAAAVVVGAVGKMPLSAVLSGVATATAVGSYTGLSGEACQHYRELSNFDLQHAIRSLEAEQG